MSFKNAKNLFIVRLFISGITKDAPISITSKLIFFRLIVLTSIPLLLPLIIDSFRHRSFLHATFNSIFLATALIGFILLANPKRMMLAFSIAFSGTFALISYIILLGGSNVYDILFIFLLPYLTYFLLDYKAGFVINCIAFLMASVAFFVPVMPLHRALADFYFIIRLYITFLISNIIAFMVAMMYSRSIKRLEHIAYYDYLTGLPNRKKLDELLDTALMEAGIRKQGICAMMLNVDNFKRINDAYSHRFGDRALQAFIERIRGILDDAYVFGRHAGADFLLFAKDCRKEEISDTAKNIHRALEEPFSIDNYMIRLSTCIGITVFPDDGEKSSSLLKNLDIALSEAKKAGPGTTSFFRQESFIYLKENYRLSELLQDAHLVNEIYLMYQPKISVKDGKVHGFEVLARWHNKELGEIPPSRFIPIAEDTGYITRLTEWIVSRAWDQYLILEEEGFHNLTMNINFSPRHINNTDFLDSFYRLIERKGINPACIEIEITEGLLLNENEAIATVLADLGKKGFKIAIDDFGTGYSSLNYIRHFNVDCIKIDRSFIMNLHKEESANEIVRAILAMAKALSLICVAEGVENETQLEFLRELQCDQIQGFYFSRPLSLPDLITYMKSGK